MNSLAGIQLLCFKNKYIYIFSPAPAFSIDQWKYCRGNGGSRGNMLLSEQLLIRSHAAEVEQLPSTLINLHMGWGRGRTGGRMRNERFPRSVCKCSPRKWSRSWLLFIFILSQTDDVWKSSSVSLTTCSSLRVAFLLVGHSTRTKRAG